jgi:hypothetical protein
LNELIKLPEIKTLTELVKHSNQLPTIRKQLGLEGFESRLERVLQDFVTQIFLMNAVEPVGMKLIVSELKKAFIGLTLADIDLCRENILKNKYYDKYNPKMTPIVLMRMVDDYKHERMEVAETTKQFKPIEEDKILPPKEALLHIGKILEVVKPKTEMELKPIEESAEMKQAKRLQKWIEDKFNSICKTHTFENGSTIKVAKHKGYNLLLKDYIAVKYSEIHEQTKSNFEAIEKIINEK